MIMVSSSRDNICRDDQQVSYATFVVFVGWDCWSFLLLLGISIALAEAYADCLDGSWKTWGE